MIQDFSAFRGALASSEARRKAALRSLIDSIPIGYTLTLVVCLAAAIQVGAYWPGLLHNDSTMQYEQALSGRLSDWHPPLMAWIWRQLLFVRDGPAPMLILQAVLYWGGFGLLIRWALRQERQSLAFAILACAFFPLPFAWIGSILKDSMLTGALLMATGLLAVARDGRDFSLRLIGMLMLFVAASLRFNAFFACIPLFVLMVPAAWRQSRGRLAATTAIATISLLAVPIAITKLVRVDASDVKLSLIIYDLGGITEYSGVDVFPALPVADPVRANHDCYTPRFWDNYGWWVKDDRCAMGFNVVRGALRRSHQDPYRLWLGAIIDHPFAYAVHRLVHFNTNIRFIVRRSIKRPIWNVPHTHFPYLIHPSPSLSVIDWVAFRNAQVPIGWPVCWMAVAAGLLVIGNRLRSRRIVVPLALSALVYALGYLPMSVASDLRYHMWTMIATALAGVIATADVLEEQTYLRKRLLTVMLPLLIVTIIAVTARLILPYGPPSA
jgi:hypothetical protein